MQLLPLDNFTLAQFSFPEGTGATSIDRTGVYTATLHNATWGSEGDTPSGVGRPVVFNGTNAYVTVADLLDGGAGEFTLNLWFKASVALPTASNDIRFFSIFGDPSTDWLDFLIRGSNNGGGLWLRGENDNNPLDTSFISDTIPALGTTDWHMLTLTFTMIGYGRMYLDGVLLKETDQLPYPCYRGGGDFPFTLGAYNDNGTAQALFTGKMAEVTVIARCLNAAEVAQVYSSGTWYPTLATKLANRSTLISGALDGPAGAMQETSAIRITGGYLHSVDVGWDAEKVYVANSTDGVNLGALRAVVGGGTGGEDGATCGRGRLMRDTGNDRIYLFYVPTITGGAWKYVTSDDEGVTWSAPVATNIGATTISGSNGVANSCIFPQEADGTYYALLEYLDESTSKWFTVALSADSLDGDWTILNSGGPLTSLRLGAGIYGGPEGTKLGATYHAFLHASSNAVTPTAIFWYTSTDFITWEVQNDGIPIVSLPQEIPPVDQSADFAFQIRDNSIVCYWSEVINGIAFSRIRYTIYPGTLTQLFTEGSYPVESLLAGAQGVITQTTTGQVTLTATATDEENVPSGVRCTIV